MLLDDLVCSIVGYLKILPAFWQARMGEAKYKRKYGLNNISFCIFRQFQSRFDLYSFEQDHTFSYGDIQVFEWNKELSPVWSA